MTIGHHGLETVVAAYGMFDSRVVPINQVTHFGYMVIEQSFGVNTPKYKEEKNDYQSLPLILPIMPLGCLGLGSF